MLCPPLTVAGSVVFYSLAPEQIILTILGGIAGAILGMMIVTNKEDNDRRTKMQHFGVKEYARNNSLWSKARIMDTDVAPLLEIVTQLEFLAYIKRTPRDIRILLKAIFKPGKKPEDLNSLYFPELLDIHHTPEEHDESYVINVKITHPLSNFNARTGGTTAVPGCRLDGEGLNLRNSGR